MKLHYNLILAAILTVFPVLSGTPQSGEHTEGNLRILPLTNGVFPLPLQGALTVKLPLPLEAGALSGSGFTLDPQIYEGDILIEHEAGAPHLHLIPLRPDFAPRNLNLLVGSYLVCLYLHPPNPGEAPVFGVIFSEEAAMDSRAHIRISRRAPQRGAGVSPPSVWENFMHLTQVIAALEIDALHFMVRANPEIEISLREGNFFDYGDHRIHLHRVVRHNGIGLVGLVLSLENTSTVSLTPPQGQCRVQSGTGFHEPVLEWWPENLRAGEASPAFMVLGPSEKAPQALRIGVEDDLVIGWVSS